MSGKLKKSHMKVSTLVSASIFANRLKVTITSKNTLQRSQNLSLISHSFFAVTGSLALASTSLAVQLEKWRPLRCSMPSCRAQCSVVWLPWRGVFMKNLKPFNATSWKVGLAFLMMSVLTTPAGRAKALACSTKINKLVLAMCSHIKVLVEKTRSLTGYHPAATDLCKMITMKTHSHLFYLLSATCNTFTKEFQLYCCSGHFISA